MISFLKRSLVKNNFNDQTRPFFLVGDQTRWSTQFFGLPTITWLTSWWLLERGSSCYYEPIADRKHYETFITRNASPKEKLFRWLKVQKLFFNYNPGGSNSPKKGTPRAELPWQPSLTPNEGLEPSASRLRVTRSTDWANRAHEERILISRF